MYDPVENVSVSNYMWLVFAPRQNLQMTSEYQVTQSTQYFGVLGVTLWVPVSYSTSELFCKVSVPPPPFILHIIMKSKLAFKPELFLKSEIERLF